MKKSQRHQKTIIDMGQSASELGFSYTTLIRVAVAQICQSVGYRGAQSEALEVLTDIAARYLKEVGKSGAACANRHSRTQSNLPDIIVALEDMELARGFTGASDLRSHYSLYESAVVEDLMRFVRCTQEIPFAQPLRFCRGGNFSNGGGIEKGRWYSDGGGHVPRWLPAMPVVERQEKAERNQEREGKWGCLAEIENNKEMCGWGRGGKERMKRELNWRRREEEGR